MGDGPREKYSFWRHPSLMIRIFLSETEKGKDEENLPLMSIIELQGSLSLPSDIFPDSEEEAAKQIKLHRKQQRHNAVEKSAADVKQDNVEAPPAWKKEEIETKEENEKKEKPPPQETASGTLPSTTSRTMGTASDASSPMEEPSCPPHYIPPTISVGFIEQDQVFPSKRVLALGTTRVVGREGRYRDPILVLRRCRRGMGHQKKRKEKKSIDAAPSWSSTPLHGASSREEEERESSLSTSCTWSSCTISSVSDEDEIHTESKEKNTRHEDKAVETMSTTVNGEEEEAAHDEEDVEKMYAKLVSSAHEWMEAEDEGNLPLSTDNRETHSEEKKERKTEKEQGNLDGWAPPMMFSDWIKDHSEMLELDTIFGDAIHPRKRESTSLSPEREGLKEEVLASPPHRNWRKREREWTVPQHALLSSMKIKDFEVVGVIEDYLVFNSKPTRVFHRNDSH